MNINQWESKMKISFARKAQYCFAALAVGIFLAPFGAGVLIGLFGLAPLVK